MIRTPLLSLAAGLLTLGAMSLQAADVNGTWTWSTPGRDGGEPRKSTMTLKADGEKLTGTVASPGREGQTRETAIANGKIKGDEITFEVAREFQGNKVVAKYSGKVAGDTIKGKIETERDGNTRSRDWEAKREAKK